MLVEMISFQERAETELRRKTARALRNYREDKEPQVVSFTAPTGAGKTIIMTKLIEDIIYGMSKYDEMHHKPVTFEPQPDAIFVWLSDSPSLNEQSRLKIEGKSDMIKINQLVTIEPESFDFEYLEDGKIYFLNTQKLGVKGNLTLHSDMRQYTIWETLENTAREKSDRLYFIIDEAHRGSKDREAGKATTIMQKFIKGSERDNLSPMPVVIGMSATIERFNKLIAGTNSSLHKVNVTSKEVRDSGLLKDRILMTHPKDLGTNNEVTMLKAAALEWKDKCIHWNQYSVTQHEAYIHPVLIIQVQNGKGDNISETNLDDCLAAIEEALSIRFNEHEVVHAFGDQGDITINGLTVHHVKPEDITGDKRIQVVIFKDSLSTGWDCPRAETMMSFRKVDEYVNIAQLLGRMVRTPLQRRIKVDMSLNNVRLYLPHYNSEAVKKVIEDLQAEEGGDIPTIIEDEDFEDPNYEHWTTKPKTPRPSLQAKAASGQCTIFDLGLTDDSGKDDPTVPMKTKETTPAYTAGSGTVITLPEKEEPETPAQGSGTTSTAHAPEQKDIPSGIQTTFTGLQLNRDEIVDFINKSAIVSYEVRNTETLDYHSALLKLCRLLVQENIDTNCYENVKADIVKMIHDHADKLKANSTYDSIAKEVTSLKFLVEVFTPFGDKVNEPDLYDMFRSSNEDLDRQSRAADDKLGGMGLRWEYARTYPDDDFRTDIILFAIDDDCVSEMKAYSKNKFRELTNKYRTVMVHTTERCERKYDSIVTSAETVSKHNFHIPPDTEQRIDKDGIDFDNHLLVNDRGIAKIKLNSWEEGVIKEEINRDDFVTWLRNPSRAPWGLTIPYRYKGKDKGMRPDFIIIRRDYVAGYIVDILEPHGPQFDDNLEKAIGLARYAKENPKLGRIQMIREKKNALGEKVYLRLDMTDIAVQSEVITASTSAELDHIFDKYGLYQ